MLICRLFLSSGSLPSAWSIIPLMFFLQCKDTSVHSWFCTAKWPPRSGLTVGLLLERAVGHGTQWGCCQELKQWPGHRSSHHGHTLHTCVCKDLQQTWEVGLVWFSWQVVDDSEDSRKMQQPVHVSSLKTSINQSYFIAPAAFRLALVPVSFLSFKTRVEI